MEVDVLASAELEGRMSIYRIVEHNVTVTQTDQWNPRPVSSVSYWIEGGGLNRLATDIEVDLWKQAEEWKAKATNE